jgi:hypothetical protein
MVEEGLRFDSVRGLQEVFTLQPRCIFTFGSDILAVPVLSGRSVLFRALAGVSCVWAAQLRVPAVVTVR